MGGELGEDLAPDVAYPPGYSEASAAALCAASDACALPVGLAELALERLEGTGEEDRLRPELHRLCEHVVEPGLYSLPFFGCRAGSASSLLPTSPMVSSTKAHGWSLSASMIDDLKDPPTPKGWIRTSGRETGSPLADEWLMP